MHDTEETTDFIVLRQRREIGLRYPHAFDCVQVIRLLQHVFEVPSLFSGDTASADQLERRIWLNYLLFLDQGPGISSAPRAGGTPNAMHVLAHVHRRIVAHYM